MRAALALGLRLATQANGASRLRSVLVALSAALGALVLLAVAAVARAEMTGGPSTYGDRELANLAVIVALCVALPVFVLAATVGRLSAALRDRRLANLRLMGLSRLHTRLVALAETGCASIVGTLVGAVAFYATRPLLALVPVRGHRHPVDQLTPWPVAIMAVVLLVPAVVAGVSALPSRLDARSALLRARRADTRRPGWWRLAILLVGVAWCLYFRLDWSDGHSALWVSTNLIGGMLSLGIGLLLVVPIAVRLIGDLLLAVGRSPAQLLAARRIQSQPAGVTRVISGLLIGLFLVTAARCVVVAFESTPQFVSAEQAITVQQKVELQADRATTTAVVADLQALPGFRAAIPTRSLYADQPGCDFCAQAVVLSCSDLARIAPGISGCRDGEPLWLREPPRGLGSTITWSADGEGNAAVATLPTPTRTATTSMTASERWAALSADVVLPPSPQLLENAADSTTTIILAAPGRDLPAALEQAIRSSGGQAGWSSFDPGEYDTVQTLHGLIGLIATVIISLGLLAFAVAAIDRAIARRREIASLQILGVPRAVLRRAQWIEAGVPIAAGSVLAIALGLLAGVTYLALDERHALPWQLALTVGMISVAGSLVVAGLTVIASAPRLRPELIRAE
jgi:putative ABC transport system permease protein